MLSRMQAADVPLDQRQLEWLIKKFDENCTGVIIYRLVCGCHIREIIKQLFMKKKK